MPYGNEAEKSRSLCLLGAGVVGTRWFRRLSSSVLLRLVSFQSSASMVFPILVCAPFRDSASETCRSLLGWPLTFLLAIGSRLSVLCVLECGSK